MGGMEGEAGHRCTERLGRDRLLRLRKREPRGWQRRLDGRGQRLPQGSDRLLEHRLAALIAAASLTTAVRRQAMVSVSVSIS
jgi:hypothetical protein